MKCPIIIAKMASWKSKNLIFRFLSITFFQYKQAKTAAPEGAACPEEQKYYPAGSLRLVYSMIAPNAYKVVELLYVPALTSRKSRLPFAHAGGVLLLPNMRRQMECCHMPSTVAAAPAHAPLQI